MEGLGRTIVPRRASRRNDRLSFPCRLFRRRRRACCWRSGRRLALLGYLGNGQYLDLLVGGRGRMGGVEQLFLAKADRLDPLYRDLERVDQDVADRVGPALAQDHVALALSIGLDMADDQEAVRQQRRMHERIGDPSKRLVGLRPDDRRVGIELDVDVETGQALEFGHDRRALVRRRLSSRPDFRSLLGFLAEAREIQFRSGVEPAELADDVVACRRRLAVRGRDGRAQDEDSRQQRDVAQADFRSLPHRYPASPMAWMHRALTPCAVVRQGIDLLVSLVEPAQVLTISRAHALATAVRAATRFWIASKVLR